MFKTDLRIQSDESKIWPWATTMPHGFPQHIFLCPLPSEVCVGKVNSEMPRPCMAWPVPTFPILFHIAILHTHLHCSLLWSECWCTPKFIGWNLHAQGDGIRRWGVWVLRFLGWSPPEWDCALFKETEFPWSSTKQGHNKKSTTQKRASSDHVDTLILDFQPLEVWEINVFYS